MKRTINEIYNLIQNKIENAHNSQLMYMKRYKELSNKDVEFNQLKACRDDIIELNGEINAYLDIQILLETSGVLADDRTGNKKD